MKIINFELPRMRQSLLCAFLVIVITFSLTTFVDANETDMPISIFINNRLLITDTDPEIINGNTIVPLRQVVEALSVDDIIWDGEEESISINTSRNTIKLIINSTTAYVNEVAYTLDVAPYISGGSAMVPLGFIAKHLDCDISWDSVTHSVMIYKKLDKEYLYAHSGDSFYTPDDIIWLARIVHVEAYDLSVEGKVAVANVILNRAKSPIFPSTVYGVIFDDNYAIQFPPAYKSGFKEINPLDDAITAAKLALGGQNNIDTCLYFNHRPFSWKSSDDLYTIIEGEYFYY